MVISNTNTKETVDDSNILFGPVPIEVDPLPRNIIAFHSGL